LNPSEILPFLKRYLGGSFMMMKFKKLPITMRKMQAKLRLSAVVNMKDNRPSKTLPAAYPKKLRVTKDDLYLELTA
jgi:hypothetical protein